jgi:hypothetical protein
MPARRAYLGAPVFIDRTELENKVAQTNSAYQAFDSDLKSKLVFFGDASDITGAIDATDATSDEKMRLQLAYLTGTGAQIQKSVANQAGKDDAEIAKEKAFYKSWLAVLTRWNLFFQRNGEIGALDHVFSLAGVWDTTDRFNAELATWKAKAKADFNVASSAPAPPIEPNAPSMGIPWGMIIGAVAGVALVTQIPTIVAKLGQK